jgi:hypothetical protein
MTMSEKEYQELRQELWDLLHPYTDEVLSEVAQKGLLPPYDVDVKECPGDPTLFHITLSSPSIPDNLVVKDTCAHCGFEVKGYAEEKEDQEESG